MSAPLARYESFLISNSSTIATIESSLRSITWFLPGRFKDAELASEALTSFLNLLSLYHDTLLARRLKHVQQLNPKSTKPLLPPSPHARYTRAWCEKEPLYKWAARLLEVVRYTELVLEMGLRRMTNKKTTWRAITLVEVLKAILRLTILHKTRRPVLSPPIPERDIDPASLPTLTEDINVQPSSPPLKPANTISKSNGLPTPDHLRNNHIPFSAARPGSPHPLLSQEKSQSRTTAIDDFLLSRALTPSSLSSPMQLMRSLKSPSDYASELLYILRPLVYVLLLKPASPGKRHNPISILQSPLIASMMIEMLSRHLRAVPPASASLERAEYAKRDRDLLWYLFRGEIWKEWTRPKLVGIQGKIHGKPLIGLLSAFIGDWIPLIDEYYYYTST